MKRYTVTIITSEGKYVKTVVFAESVTNAKAIAETNWPGRTVGVPIEMAG